MNNKPDPNDFIKPYLVKANPDYPGKGERAYCVYRIVDNGGYRKLPRQFNKYHTAFRYAHDLAALHYMRHNRRIYVGD